MSKRSYLFATYVCCLILLVGIMPIRAQKIVSAPDLSFTLKKPPVFASTKEGYYLLFLSKDYLDIACYDTSFHFSHSVVYGLENVLNSKTLVCAVETGPSLTILFRDKKHFTTLIYHPLLKKFELGKNFELDDFFFLNWFSYDDKLHVLAVKNKTSLLSIVGFDSAGSISKKEFELSNDSLLDASNAPLSRALSATDEYGITTGSGLKRINPIKYCSDLEAKGDCKMYTYGDELMISLNRVAALNQVIRLNLRSGDHRIYTLPYPKQSSDPSHTSYINSFVIGHRVVSAYDYISGLDIGIYDLDSAKYLKIWKSDATTSQSFRSSAFINENMVNGRVDSMKSWDKFYRKYLNSSVLSISAFITHDNRMDLYFGGINEHKQSGFGMGGVPMMGGAGMTMMPTFVPVGGFPGTAKSSNDLDVERHYYFTGTLDARTLEPMAPSAESMAYKKYKAGYIEIMREPTYENVLSINLGRKFYVGYNTHDSHQYVITEYK